MIMIMAFIVVNIIKGKRVDFRTTTSLIKVFYCTIVCATVVNLFVCFLFAFLFVLFVFLQNVHLKMLYRHYQI